jgi:chromosome segregation ATPase
MSKSQTADTGHAPTDATRDTKPSAKRLEAEIGALRRRHDELTEEVAEAAAALHDAQEAAIQGGDGVAQAVTEAQARHTALEGTLGRVAERLATAEAALREAERKQRVETLLDEAKEQASAAGAAKTEQRALIAELVETFDRLVAESVARGKAYDQARRAVARLARQAEREGATSNEYWGALRSGETDLVAAADLGSQALGLSGPITSTWPAPPAPAWPEGTPGALKEAVNVTGGRIARAEQQERQREEAKSARLASERQLEATA